MTESAINDNGLIIRPSETTPFSDEDRKILFDTVEENLTKLRERTSIYVDSRDVFIMMTLLKEQQDTIYELAKGGA